MPIHGHFPWPLSPNFSEHWNSLPYINAFSTCQWSIPERLRRYPCRMILLWPWTSPVLPMISLQAYRIPDLQHNWCFFIDLDCLAVELHSDCDIVFSGELSLDVLEQHWAFADVYSRDSWYVFDPPQWSWRLYRCRPWTITSFGIIVGCQCWRLG